MAQFDGYISINGVDLSSYCRSLTWTEGANANDDTTMGDSTQTSEAGLKTVAFSATFKEDWGTSGGPYDTLKSLPGGSAVTVIYGANGGTASASNPHRSCSMLITEYNAPSGEPGVLAVSSVAGVAAGDVSEVTA